MGTHDRWLPFVRRIRKDLEALGYPIRLHELKGRGHEYASLSKKINRLSWNFLKEHRLGFPPYYTEYDFGAN